ncbi:HNH endonuclease [Ectothiorhodospira shaposhnikovii]|uniref:HNH endonuclease n=1 Tax=Ectothiorhodospira shaposhnikovii TaxID=1054 RepID=UPI0019080F06|nr:HNH endonuclease [Ectothiorhodospira shaposhnikovii]
MSRKCIICGKPAGSREHLFPAAFGGRRVSKKIYCEAHNNALGIHVVALLEALEYFNAALGVRSDHRRSPKPYEVEVETGERFHVLRDQFDIAPPRPLRETPELVERSATLKFSSKEQFYEWAESQRRDGYKVQKISESKFEKQYFSGPIKLSMEFGNEEFRRAIAYLGLTYLAHYYPDAARQSGLESIKLYVLGEEPVEDRVWWVDPHKITSCVSGEFKATHFVTVVIEEGGNSYAQVGFFGNLCLTVSLGSVQGVKPECVTTYINSTAESAAPDIDVIVDRELGGGIHLGSPEQGKEYLSKVIGGEIAHPVSQILKALDDEHLNAEVEGIRRRLDDAQGQPKDVRENVLVEIVDEQGQRIFNHLHTGISELIERNRDFPAHIRARLEELIAPDSDSPSGLSDAALTALERGKIGFANEISRLQENGQLTDETLKLLLAGGLGCAAVLRPVLDDFQASLPQ